MSLRFAVSYLATVLVTGSIVSQVLAWLSWFSPFVLFIFASVVGLTVAHVFVVRPQRRTRADN